MREKIRTILLASGHLISNLCANATKEEEVLIKLFPGISIGTKYAKGKTSKLPGQETCQVSPPHLKGYCKFGLPFKQAIKSPKTNGGDFHSI